MMTPEQIKAARQAARLTQKQAAEKIQVSLRAWQQWEGGQRNMPLAMQKYFKLQIERDIAFMNLQVLANEYAASADKLTDGIKALSDAYIAGFNSRINQET